MLYSESYDTFNNYGLSIKMNQHTFTKQLLNRLRMRQVALLLAIDEHGTLRAAANSLGMTQPAATKMRQELERALGHTLFEPDGRGLKLTPSGQSVLDSFRGMRGSIESLGRELTELRLGSAGKLFIGSIMAASPERLTHALIQIKAIYPLLSVEISVGTSDHLIEQMRDGALDLVIGRPLHLSMHDYVFQPIEDEALAVVVACDHPLANIKMTKTKMTKSTFATFTALTEYPWILQPRGSPMREVMEQEFKSHHATVPKGLIETASILTTTNLIAKTQMIAVIPHSIASRYEEHGLLRILPYKVMHQLSAYGSIVRRDRPVTAAAARFLELLHQPN
jgi:DNA-binding transcriptional LysR family regulator